MSLLVVEILLAGYALRRRWRVVPALLAALPFVVLGFLPASAGPVGRWIGAYLDPVDTARAIAHGVSLLGLALICWADLTELPTAGRPRSKRAPHPTGPLYQI